MANLTLTNFDPQDGVRSCKHSEQALMTSAGAVTTYALTILGRVTSGEKWCPYAANDSPTGANVARAILLNTIVADGAGDDPAGVMLEGEVEESKIRIYGGTVGANITEAIKDSLRQHGIFVVTKTEVNALDNQS